MKKLRLRKCVRKKKKLNYGQKELIRKNKQHKNSKTFRINNLSKTTSSHLAILMELVLLKMIEKIKATKIKVHSKITQAKTRKEVMRLHISESSRLNTSTRKFLTSLK